MLPGVNNSCWVMSPANSASLQYVGALLDGQLERGRMGVLLRCAIRAAGRPPVWLGVALVFDVAITVVAISPGQSVKLSALLGVAPLLTC
jgi:hypothetical protein